MSAVKEILNIFYLLSGPAIAVISYLALKQIKIAKKQLAIAKTSMEISSKRDAAVFTAKQCDIFANDIIVKFSEVTKKFDEKEISIFELPDGKDYITECEYSQWLHKYIEKVFENKQEIYTLIAMTLNDMEAFSIYFTHQICDINIAYLPVASTFVEIIEALSPMICFSRSSDKNAYSNILKLYEIWKKKIVKETLEIKQKELYQQFVDAQQKASCIIETELEPIGVSESKRVAVHDRSK